MQPTIFTLEKRDATQWLEILLSLGEVIAPVRGSEGDVIFSTPTGADDVL